VPSTTVGIFGSSIGNTAFSLPFGEESHGGFGGESNCEKLADVGEIWQKYKKRKNR
jgi:hypothetical protein